jgi:hypothetical protein
MDAIMETIFVASGYIVNLMGGALAILLVAFLPLYCYGFVAYQKTISFHSSRSALLALLAAIVLTILLTAVFAMTAVVLGVWG